MNHNALSVYVRNLRDLELAKRKLKEIFRKEQLTFEQKKEHLGSPHYLRYAKVHFSQCVNLNLFLISLLSLAASVFLFRSVTLPSAASKDLMTAVLSLLLLAFGVGGVAYTISLLRQTQKKVHQQNERARLHNHKERDKQTENKLLLEQVQADWDIRRHYLETELEQVERLLQNGYELDILPAVSQGLSTIYCTCDYMTNAVYSSLEEAMNQQGDLETTIAQNMDSILHNRKLESTSNTNDPNIQLFHNYSKMEPNHELSAKYDAIAEQYSKSNVYFSLASYL